MGGNNLEQVNQTKILGLVLRDDLSWRANTETITKRAFSRMIILRNLFQLNEPVEDLLYFVYKISGRAVSNGLVQLYH